ncbi:hypothetical protein SteCoe_14812 [Stentor coeruleus]|uniref:Intimal thickness related receptor IRP domain-containing protein n=1 Tax=Stentor coeruleus TaxID=5963 RepID=A0A1R2C564_9CILI|nr:hypothetical protein SteCoe_14812 [Stentor coeruleus]
MLILITLLLAASSEWVGNITLYPSNNIFTGIRAITKNSFRKIDLNFTICWDMAKSFNCSDKVVILQYSNTTEEIITSLNPSAAIIISNITHYKNFTIPVFEISEKNAQGLINFSDTIMRIRYSKNPHCEEYTATLAILTLTFILWGVGVFLWIHNNSRTNSAYAELFHKFSTTILIFKVLNLFANLMKLSFCHVDIDVTQEFLDLLNKQTRSLYETAFFAYIILLSKGWSLIMNTMDRKEFNYLIIVIIIIYIFDSAVNIIGERIVFGIWFLYLIVVVHCFGFALQTFKVLNNQLQAVRDTGMDLLIPITKSKRLLFVAFCGFMCGYFAEEYFVHEVFGWKYNPYVKLDYEIVTLFHLFHEMLEMVTIGGIFYLYRARNMGRFFTMEFDSRESFRRVLPFYESKETCQEGVVMAVCLPRNKIIIGKIE